MTVPEFRRLQAEQGAIKRMLDEMPADHVIDRIGLEVRRERIAKALDEMSRKEPVSAPEYRSDGGNDGQTPHQS
jgi:hypothetical protein